MALSSGLGKAPTKKLRVAIIAVIIVAVMIIGAIASLKLRSTPHPSEAANHSPIWIGEDSDFTPDNGVVRGNGTAADPYIIDGWDIKSSSQWDGRMAGIQIINANVHFTVRNCHSSESASNHRWGIYLVSCVNGKLENNNCSNNECGIYLDLSGNITLSNNSCFSSQLGIGFASCTDITIINNTCSDGGVGIDVRSSRNTLTKNTCSSNIMDGMRIESPGDNNTLENNTCCWNRGTGMAFSASSNNAVRNNTCSSNRGSGIGLFWSCNNSYVSGNTCNLNGEDGMNLYSSSTNTLTDNDFSSNNQSGISLSNLCNGNDMTWNRISNNAEHAIAISSGSDNLIFGNAIIDNNGASSTYNASRIQAYDYGTHNSWNCTYVEIWFTSGNYWSDWTTPDVAPPQSIVDHPYVIEGSAAAKDYYPLTYNPLYIGIASVL